VLRGEELIVMGSHDRFDLLERLVITLPLAVRRSLAVSVGLKYSPSRRLQLSLVASDRGETERIIRGRQVRVLDVQVPGSWELPPCEGWLNLADRWLEAGRERELQQLIEEISEGVSAGDTPQGPLAAAAPPTATPSESDDKPALHAPPPGA
jgi:hypothetical protein